MIEIFKIENVWGIRIFHIYDFHTETNSKFRVKSVPNCIFTMEILREKYLSEKELNVNFI